MLLNYFREKENRLADLIPALEQYSQNKRDEPVKVELYKGLSGFKTIISDIINDGKDYYLFGKLHFEELIPYYIAKIIKEIEKKGIKETAIIEEGLDLTKIKDGRYRWLSKKYLLANTTAIYGDKVAQFIWEKPYYVILIRSKDIAKTYMTQFELLWNKAKP
jgi:hypothetical protein